MGKDKLLLTDREFALLKKGDHAVFEKVFLFYYGKIKTFAATVLADDSYAAEISQISMIKLWESRESLKSPDTLDGYIFTVARNSILMDCRRRRYDKKVQDTSIHTLPKEDSSLEPLLGLREISSRIDKIIGTLPERRKEVFLLSRNQNLSNEEIASRLGLSKRTVEKHISLVLEELREGLKDFLINF